MGETNAAAPVSASKILRVYTKTYDIRLLPMTAPKSCPPQVPTNTNPHALCVCNHSYLLHELLPEFRGVPGRNRGATSNRACVAFYSVCISLTSTARPLMNKTTARDGLDAQDSVHMRRSLDGTFPRAFSNPSHVSFLPSYFGPQAQSQCNKSWHAHEVCHLSLVLSLPDLHWSHTAA